MRRSGWLPLASERAQVAIVGAGVTGLAAACELGAGAIVLDRIPVCGGVTGWRHPMVAQLERRARAAGARLVLGVTATRWEDGRLLVIGPDGPLRVAAGILLIAAGSRPLGRAELRLTGARPAGVMPATVACHLAESGLPAGRRPIVLGGGDWAERATRELLAAGARSVSVVAPEGLLRPFPGSAAVRVHERAAPVAIEGGPRVTGLVTDAGLIEGDALVLAHGLAPLRNVDGAVESGDRTVYAQPVTDPASVSAAIAAGRAAAESTRRRAAA
jgi:glycine/D-amino acid oxidase-like deaminating enzyme